MLPIASSKYRKRMQFWGTLPNAKNMTAKRKAPLLNDGRIPLEARILALHRTAPVLPVA